MKHRISPRMLMAACLFASPLSTLIAPPAKAQLAVYDPANHVENILQAVRALEELDNQVEQMSHEIKMIEHMARDLETLPVNVAHALIRDRMTRISEVLRKAEGIAFNVDNVERLYDEAYPQSYGAAPPSSTDLYQDALARWEQSRTAHRDVVRLAAEANAGMIANNDALSQLIDDSQGAAGNLQALQAGNQLAAMSADQLIQIEALMAAHYRAISLDEARRLAEAERGRARLKSFLGD
ncbi:MAG: P-type conjugative transfer protein TrbJ [Nitrospira sp.]|nr:P-type conjugative transfer protein TrbJ [Nitrospira sp.]